MVEQSGTPIEQIVILREKVAGLEATVSAHEKALTTAKIELDRRLMEMNEFRAQINEERGEFLDRNSYYREHELIRGRVGELEKSRAGALGSIGAYGSMIAILLAIAAIAITFWNK